MKRNFSLLLFCFIAFCASGQTPEQNTTTGFEGDSISPKTNISLMASFNYSSILMNSNPYFLDPAGAIGYSDIKNSFGGSIGLAYYLELNDNWLFRPSLQSCFLPAAIKYDTKLQYRESSNVFPLTIELPFTFIYSKYGIDGRNNSVKKIPEFFAGLRPVFPLVQYADVRPKLKLYNLNTDVGIGYPFHTSKACLRLELFYSYGIFNIIGEDNADIKTSSIESLNRNYFGFALYVN